MSKRTNGVDYKESVIVPLDVFNTFCSVPERGVLPVDLKVKLADQKAWARRQVGLSKPKRAYLQSDPGKRKIADLKSKIKFYHPFLEDILNKYIQRYPEQIDWQPDTYAIILDRRVVPKSNLLRSLHYLLAPEVFDYRRPIGTEKLRDKLLSVGVNEGWLYDEQFENAEDLRTPKIRETGAKTNESAVPIEALDKEKGLVDETPKSISYARTVPPGGPFRSPLSEPRSNFATPDSDFITPTTGWLTTPRRAVRGRGPSRRVPIASSPRSGPSWLTTPADNRGRRQPKQKQKEATAEREKGSKGNASSPSFSPIAGRTRKQKKRVNVWLSK